MHATFISNVRSGCYEGSVMVGGNGNIMEPAHYAPETFKMGSKGLTLLMFDQFTATQILREIKF